MLNSALRCALFLGAAASALDLRSMAARQAQCPKTQFFVSRASTEVPGPGIIGPLATDIQQDRPGTEIIATDYPATLQNYNSSESQGVTALTKLMLNFTQVCPETPMVLLGYSQGAQVSGDVLCGGGQFSTGPNGEMQPKTKPISKNISSKVKAVVLMGDPRFITKQAFNAGTSKTDGIFPRQKEQSCSDFSKIMRSYCDEKDPFCASGNETEVHLTYMDRYRSDARSFINNALKASANAAVERRSPSVPALLAAAATVFGVRFR